MKASQISIRSSVERSAGFRFAGMEGRAAVEANADRVEGSKCSCSVAVAVAEDVDAEGEEDDDDEGAAEEGGRSIGAEVGMEVC